MRKLNVLISALAIGAMGLPALAQDAGKPGQPGAGQPQAPRGNRGGDRGGPAAGGRGGFQQLDPEKAKAAWELEATGVAKHLGLSADQTKSLVKAYGESRSSLDKARTEMMEKMRKQREEGGDAGNMGDMRKTLDDMNAAEKSKFEKALGSSLSADQKTKVMASLGSFNPMWDRIAVAVSELNLDAKKQQDVLNTVEEYVVATGKARTGDPQETREAMREAREKAQESLKKTLNEEQYGKIEAAMGPGGRGRGQGGPGAGGDGERPRRGDGQGGGNGGGRGRGNGGGGGGGGGGGR